jgi:hypothetical protein
MRHEITYMSEEFRRILEFRILELESQMRQMPGSLTPNERLELESLRKLLANIGGGKGSDLLPSLLP